MNIATVLEARRTASPIARRSSARRARQLRRADRAAASAAACAAPASRAGARAIFSPMSIALYTTMIALFRLRTTAVFVDPSSGRERLIGRSVVSVRMFVAVPRATGCA
jgi:hypothetical protein